jgi:hypothetical protein
LGVHPDFAILEKRAGLDHWRAYYKLASHGWNSCTREVSLLEYQFGPFERVPSGRSVEWRSSRPWASNAPFATCRDILTGGALSGCRACGHVEGAAEACGACRSSVLGGSKYPRG